MRRIVCSTHRTRDPTGSRRLDRRPSHRCFESGRVDVALSHCRALGIGDDDRDDGGI